MHPELELMYDNAPGHSAQYTLEERGIVFIFWPAYSPDLNPIETLWNKMKIWLQENYGKNFTYDQLRAAVRAAWDAMLESLLQELIDSMSARCQAVIDANGLHLCMY